MQDRLTSPHNNLVDLPSALLIKIQSCKSKNSTKVDYNIASKLKACWDFSRSTNLYRRATFLFIFFPPTSVSIPFSLLNIFPSYVAHSLLTLE